MKRLQKDWLTQEWIDFEYKKFVVLAYLQEVRQHFSDKKLYPDLTDLHDHYENGVQFRSRKGTLSRRFPKDVTGFDLEKLTLRYEPRTVDDTYLQQVDAIVDFALPRFREARDEGQQMAQEIEAELKLQPIGVLPLRKEEGYLFLHWTSKPETYIYQFNTTLYTGLRTTGRRVRMQYLESVRKGIGKTFEGLKLELIRRQPHLPNPATYLIEAKQTVPLEETLLPMAQRLVEQQGKAR
ncbi:hypothetical protein [Tellurirhabdus bombi]|uniref:hypothetical protein n=1 Tax=Tellurirhabdus bombi TaxID=2907205 RepID=UPI001F202803|nr:hypothetical protein [Tellurirhabdus bombi]